MLLTALESLFRGVRVNSFERNYVIRSNGKVNAVTSVSLKCLKQWLNSVTNPYNNR